MKDSLKIVGTLRIFKNGKLVATEKNLVVATGLNVIANRLIGTSKNALSHMGIGTGTTAPTASDTALENQKSTRLAGTSIVATAGVVTITATFPGSSYAGTITEAGLFNAASLGEIISRVLLSVPQVVAYADALTIEWSLTFANA